MSKYVMALDQGTTSSRCIIFDHQGKIIAKAQKSFNKFSQNQDGLNIIHWRYGHHNYQ